MRPELRPPPSTKSTSAAIFGPMLPASNWSSAWCRRASASVMRSSQRWSACRSRSPPSRLRSGDQHVGVHVARQQARGEVLVDHRLDAAQVAVLVLDHRDAAAAAGDDHVAGRASAAMISISMIARGWATAPRAASRGRRPRATVQPSCCAPAPCARLLHVRADRLGRVGECRVVAVDQRLGDDARPACAGCRGGGTRCAERLHEHVADRALRVGAGIVHRHRRHLVRSAAPSGAG